MKTYNDFLDVVPVGGRAALLEHSLKSAKLKGVIFEFGVYQGNSVRKMAELTDSKIFGFDSFEGLPEPWIHGRKDFKKGHFAVAQLPEVPESVELIKGFFDKTLIPFVSKFRLTGEKIRLIHIDCDLYSSAIFVLKTLNDLIDVGTVILFDELCDFSDDGSRYPNWLDGEWKALNEWSDRFGREYEIIGRSTKEQAAIKVTK